MDSRFAGRVFTALILIALGGIFLSNQLGYTDLDIGTLAGQFWPVILILLGLRGLFPDEYRGGAGRMIGSLVLLLVGSVFLWNHLSGQEISIGDVFQYAIPAGLVAIGLLLLLRSGRRREDNIPPFEERDARWERKAERMERKAERWEARMDAKRQRMEEEAHTSDHTRDHAAYGGAGAYSHHSLNRSGFIGDLHLGQELHELVPIHASQLAGNITLDLRHVSVPPGETKINVSLMFGEIHVALPADERVGVRIRGSALAGDFHAIDRQTGGLFPNIDYQTPFYEGEACKIVLNVSLMFGSVKVRRVYT